jgi:hypothetical protein
MLHPFRVALLRVRSSRMCSVQAPPCTVVRPQPWLRLRAVLTRPSRSLHSPLVSRRLLVETELNSDARSRREPRWPAQLWCVARRSCTTFLSRQLQEEPGARITLWVKRPGARYTAVKDVDAQQTVHSFVAHWLADEQLDVLPSLATPSLVPCGSRTPTADDEEAAVVLDPRLTLAAAGVTDGCSLLVDTEKLALLASEREEEAARARADRNARSGA